MNIAFWSEEAGSGMTSSMAAVASICSDVWNIKTVLLQSRNQKGDHFILPCGYGEVELQGEMELIAASI